MSVDDDPKSGHLFEKVKHFVEREEPFWVSPLVGPEQLSHAPGEAGVNWHFLVKKEAFFEKKRFLQVLVEEPDQIEDAQVRTSTNQLDRFHFPLRNLALVRDLITEVKRTI